MRKIMISRVRRQIQGTQRKRMLSRQKIKMNHRRQGQYLIDCFSPTEECSHLEK
jgi:hypothetical protein